jgi:hypothetical protein
MKFRELLNQLDQLDEARGLTLADVEKAVATIQNTNQRGYALAKLATDNNLPGLYDPYTGQFVSADIYSDAPGERSGPKFSSSASDEQNRYLASKGLIDPKDISKASLSAYKGLLGTGSIWNSKEEDEKLQNAVRDRSGQVIQGQQLIAKQEQELSDLLDLVNEYWGLRNSKLEKIKGSATKTKAAIDATSEKKESVNIELALLESFGYLNEGFAEMIQAIGSEAWAILKKLASKLGWPIVILYSCYIAIEKIIALPKDGVKKEIYRNNVYKIIAEEVGVQGLFVLGAIIGTAIGAAVGIEGGPLAFFTAIAGAVIVEWKYGNDMDRMADMIVDWLYPDGKNDIELKPEDKPADKPNSGGGGDPVNLPHTFNPELAKLQGLLKKAGYALGKFGPNKDGVDGIMGDFTEKAIARAKADGKFPKGFDQFLSKQSGSEVGPLASDKTSSSASVITDAVKKVQEQLLSTLNANGFKGDLPTAIHKYAERFGITDINAVANLLGLPSPKLSESVDFSKLSESEKMAHLRDQLTRLDEALPEILERQKWWRKLRAMIGLESAGEKMAKELGSKIKWNGEIWVREEGTIYYVGQTSGTRTTIEDIVKLGKEANPPIPVVEPVPPRPAGERPPEAPPSSGISGSPVGTEVRDLSGVTYTKLSDGKWYKGGSKKPIEDFASIERLEAEAARTARPPASGERPAERPAGERPAERPAGERPAGERLPPEVEAVVGTNTVVAQEVGRLRRMGTGIASLLKNKSFLAAVAALAALGYFFGPDGYFVNNPPDAPSNTTNPSRTTISGDPEDPKTKEAEKKRQEAEQKQQIADTLCNDPALKDMREKMKALIADLKTAQDAEVKAAFKDAMVTYNKYVFPDEQECLINPGSAPASNSSSGVSGNPAPSSEQPRAYDASNQIFRGPGLYDKNTGMFAPQAQ